MSWRIVVFIAALGLLPSAAFANCGSDHCPIDLGMLWERSVLMELSSSRSTSA